MGNWWGICPANLCRLAFPSAPVAAFNSQPLGGLSGPNWVPLARDSSGGQRSHAHDPPVLLGLSRGPSVCKARCSVPIGHFQQVICHPSRRQGTAEGPRASPAEGSAHEEEGSPRGSDCHISGPEDGKQRRLWNSSGWAFSASSSSSSCNYYADVNRTNITCNVESSHFSFK